MQRYFYLFEKFQNFATKFCENFGGFFEGRSDNAKFDLTINWLFYPQVLKILKIKNEMHVIIP